MGFASKLANAQNPANMSNPANNPSSGVYGGAPPTGYTGGPPPASLQPGGGGAAAAGGPGGYSQQPQYQAYPGSPAQAGGSPPPRPGSIPSPYPNPTPPPQSQYQAYPPSVPPNKPVPGAPPSPYPASPHHAPSPINPSYPPTPYNPGPAPQGFSQAPPYGADPYGQPPQGYGRPPPPAPYPQPYGGPGPQYPPQPSYAPYPSPYPPQGAPYPGGAARPPQPGPPGPQGAPYGPPGGGPPPAMRATDAQISAYRQLLIATIQEKQLQPFYPPQKLDQLIQGLANDAPGKVNKIVHEWAVPTEVAMDIIKLSLFDVVLYVDDSGSIEFEEKGVRKEQLKQIIGIIATAASTFDEDGISVRFMNSMELGDGIRNADDVHRLVARVRFSGLTPLGTNLKNKVLDPMVVGPARAGRLQKPVLVITITDGQPAGEPLDSVAQAIRYATDEVARTPLGRGAVSFQFSQVGNDPKARDFLGSLDEDPSIGGLIDCTSNFEVEQDEMSRANPPVHLTRELWCAKLMLGAIDSSYDTQDERGGSRPSGGPSGPPPPGPPPGQYGGYSQAPSYSQPGYPSPGPSYGQPSPYSPGPGYGQPPYPPSQGQPPASGYGQPYGGYGAPPPQQGPPPGGAARGYPPQGPYGQAPPPPPRY